MDIEWLWTDLTFVCLKKTCSIFKVSDYSKTKVWLRYNQMNSSDIQTFDVFTVHVLGHRCWKQMVTNLLELITILINY